MDIANYYVICNRRDGAPVALWVPAASGTVQSTSVDPAPPEIADELATLKRLFSTDAQASEPHS